MPSKLRTGEELIDFREVLGKHTGENLADMLLEICDVYDIAHKVN